MPSQLTPLHCGVQVATSGGGVLNRELNILNGTLAGLGGDLGQLLLGGRRSFLTQNTKHNVNPYIPQ